jgi:hypothetical protein
MSTFGDMARAAGMPDAVYKQTFMLFGQIKHRPPVEIAVVELEMPDVGSRPTDEVILAAAEAQGMHHSPYEKVVIVPVTAVVRLRSEASLAFTDEVVLAAVRSDESRPTWWVAEELRCDIMAAKRHLVALEAKGLVRRDSERGDEFNVYWFRSEP